MKKSDIAISFHNQGFNCAQSVVLAYADDFNLDKTTVLKLSEGFGLGISGAYTFCGALSGVVMISGLVNADGKMIGGTTKHNTYEQTKKLIDEFKLRVGSINCEDIKGVFNNSPLMTCNEAIKIACEIIDKYLVKSIKSMT